MTTKMKDFIKEKWLYNEYLIWRRKQISELMKTYYTPRKSRMDREKRNEKIIDLFKIWRRPIDIHYTLDIPYQTIYNVVSWYRNRLIIEKLSSNDRLLKLK